MDASGSFWLSFQSGTGDALADEPLAQNGDTVFFRVSLFNPLFSQEPDVTCTPGRSSLS